MNKITKILSLTLILIFTVSALFVSAEPVTPTMNATWEGDYENMEIVIRFASPATYNQQVSVVMYPDGASPVFENFCRVAEAVSIAGRETEVRLKIHNDLTANGSENGGKYKIKLQGNGLLTSQCVQILDVDVFTPVGAADLLGRINAATENSVINSCLNEAKEELQITVDGNMTKIGYLKNIRDIDYNGSFTNLNEVKKSYIIADVLTYLHSQGATTENIGNLVEEYSDIIGFDVTDADYTANKSSVLQMINSSKGLYETRGILTTKILKKALNEMTAVSAINVCTTDKLYDKMDQYKEVFEITNSSYNTYLGFSEETKQIVLRQVYNKNFSFKEQVKAAFETGVTDVGAGAGDGAGAGGSQVPDGGDYSDKGSFGGDNASLGGGGADAGNENVEEIKAQFSDLPQTHWAFTYIDSLWKSNNVSGYTDNTFRPENTVTREEFVKMAVSAVGFYDRTAESSFSDVNSDHWAYRYISSACQKSIINGINETTFGLGSPITREDVAVITARIIDLVNKTEIAKQQGISTAFTDDSDISEYAKTSVKMLVNEGIISGFEDDSFKPKDYLTRAQSAKIIYMLRSSLS